MLMMRRDSTSKLQNFGWNSFFESNFQPYAEENVAGRVTFAHREYYRAATEQGEWQARISGKLRHGIRDPSEFPAVGDWVVLRSRFDRMKGTIVAVLPRKGKLSRKVAGPRTTEQVIAANVDTVFLVSALNRELNRRRIERYLALAWGSGARPVILLNKADLCRKIDSPVQEVTAAACDVPVHVLSAFERADLIQLKRYLQPGETVVFLGSSGVGKSTLINQLLGREEQAVQAVRESDDHGRHTTTHCELVRLPGGALVIDTPGLRELQVWEQGGFSRTFEEIRELGSRCRFPDCRHEEEPDCAVRLAVEQGTIDPDRFQNYKKLEREAHFLRRKQDQRAHLEEKRKWKAIHKAMKKSKNPKRFFS